jgi:osmotically-inducible protein OsmY
VIDVLPVQAFFLVALVTQLASVQAAGFGQFFRDEELARKVSSKLQFNEKLLREQIDVKVNQGVITLSGNVSSTELVELAGKLAAETSGVVKVNNRLRVGAPESD